jgi:hypothetical protein
MLSLLQIVFLIFNYENDLIILFLIQVSILLRGKQMVEILNECHINAACVGNHDFGTEILY